MCFRKALTTWADKKLTVAEVESLWKIDRVRFVVIRKCGERFLTWYDDLRAKWK